MRTICAVLLVFASLLTSYVTQACGGMLFNNHEQRHGGMSDQRVLIAHTPKETVMVVSVGYQGASEKFAFLLPLQKPTSHVADADPNLFDQLEDETGPRVIVEDGTAKPPAAGCACASPTDGNMATHAGGPPPSVTVVDRGQTQTYDYVVLSGTDASSVSAWLTKEGFAAPPEFQQSIDTYLGRGWVFLAAKLLSDAPEGNLAPLELHFADIPLNELSYPFGLSAHSLARGGNVAITLYLAGPSPMLPVDYAVKTIATEQLKAVSSMDSNYDDVFEKTVEDGGFVNEYGGVQRNAFQFMTGKTAEKLSSMVGDRGTLVRLRSKLNANSLKDTGFRPATIEEAKQTNVHRVVWLGATPRSPASGASMFGWGLIMLVAIARRRWVS